MASIQFALAWKVFYLNELHKLLVMMAKCECGFYLEVVSVITFEHMRNHQTLRYKYSH